MEHQSSPPECHLVERVFTTQMEAATQRIQLAEQNIQGLNGKIDGHVDKLWERLNQGFDDLKVVIANHAKDDSDAMHRVENALLTRVPAWALGIMTIGGSIIGALSMYILTHK